MLPRRRVAWTRSAAVYRGWAVSRLRRVKYFDPEWWLVAAWCALVFSWRAWLVWCIRHTRR